nr:hypothetical protein B0A51_14210 [Rachicladosporium sp. CCFEE 5018]
MDVDNVLCLVLDRRTTAVHHNDHVVIWKLGDCHFHAAWLLFLGHCHCHQQYLVDLKRSHIHQLQAESQRPPVPIGGPGGAPSSPPPPGPGPIGGPGGAAPFPPASGPGPIGGPGDWDGNSPQSGTWSFDQSGRGSSWGGSESSGGWSSASAVAYDRSDRTKGVNVKRTVVGPPSGLPHMGDQLPEGLAAILWVPKEVSALPDSTLVQYPKLAPDQPSENESKASRDPKFAMDRLINATVAEASRNFGHKDGPVPTLTEEQEMVLNYIRAAPEDVAQADSDRIKSALKAYRDANPGKVGDIILDHGEAERNLMEMQQKEDVWPGAVVTPEYVKIIAKALEVPEKRAVAVFDRLADEKATEAEREALEIRYVESRAVHDLWHTDPEDFNRIAHEVYKIRRQRGFRDAEAYDPRSEMLSARGIVYVVREDRHDRQQNHIPFSEPGKKYDNKSGDKFETEDEALKAAAEGLKKWSDERKAKAKGRGIIHHEKTDKIRDHSPSFRFDGKPGAPPPPPLAAWFGSPSETTSINDILELCIAERDKPAACVIEAINFHWIARIGHFLDIEPAFFAEYFINPAASDPWAETFDQYECKDKPDDHCRSRHIDGVFEVRHLSGQSDPLTALRNAATRPAAERNAWLPVNGYAPSCTMRISYCRVTPLLYLFLVDPELSTTPNTSSRAGKHDGLRPGSGQTYLDLCHDRRRTDLRVAYSTRRGGIFLPQLVTHHEHRLYDIFCSFFYHRWHLNVLFSEHIDKHTAIGREFLLHFVATSTWRTNLLTINREIKKVSFKELRQPVLSTNTKLHDLREELDVFITGFSEIFRGRSGLRREHNEMLQMNNPDRLNNLTESNPLAHLQDTMKDAQELQRFLMDSFQLLISSVSVMDIKDQAAQTKISQAQNDRAARLTQLAFVYVPLSFVTGIFGMNIREINDSPVPAWICVVALVVVAVATGAIFGGYEVWKLLTKKEQPANGLGTVTPSPSTLRLVDVEKGQKQA